MNRIIYLDYVKTLAILLVVFFHSGIITYELTSPILAMCVPLFFVANGALLLPKQKDVRYYISKIIKILILTVFWATLSSVTHSAILGEAITIRNTMSNVLTLRMGYAHIYWFTATLCILYATYPLIHSSLQNKATYWFAFTMSFLLSFTAFGYKIPLPFMMSNLLTCWQGESLFYAIAGLGIVSGRFDKINTKLIFVAAILCFLFQLLMYVPLPLTDFFTRHTPNTLDVSVFSMYRSPFVMIQTVCIVLLLSRINVKENRMVSYIGNNTFGIYVMHGLFIGLFRLYGEDNNIIHYLAPFVAVILSCFVIYILSMNKYTKSLIRL